MNSMDAIPNALTSRAQWITWRLENDQKRPNCKWQDPSQWVAFGDLKGFSRIGFVFTADDDLCGIDLDDCINEGGYWSWLSIEVLQRFRDVAYAEISPSGTGVKLWTRAKKPEWAKCTNGSTV
jgi:primase-polymerase (primpol)-like protein